MAAEERTEQLIGSVLPDVTLASVTAPYDAWSLHRAAAKHRGALLVIWSSVCSHCARYDAYMNAFAANHPDITMVGVASRQGETQDEVRKAIDSRQLSFPILYDTGSAVARQLFTQQTPRVFLVDSESRLIYRGAIDNFKYAEDTEYEAYLEPAIKSLLAGEPVVRPDTPSFGCAIASVYYTIPRPLKKI
jgi:Redoxin